MKTEKVIDLLKFWRDNCDLTIRHNGNLVDCKKLLRDAAEKMGRLDKEVEIRDEKIKALKKKNRDLRKEISTLKKELAEREAAPGWISVEERLPEESGYYLAYDCRGNLFICLYQANGLWDSSSVDYWMPLPEPPKKVKTYKDVYRERIKEVFPDFTNKDPKPSYCRPAMFGEDFNREYICGKMKDCEECWNQPYPEEEGGAE